MGQVLSQFRSGFPGAVSRSVDYVIQSHRNASEGEIPFGAPVFHVAGECACKPYDASATEENFLGIAVRAAAKTPDTYGESTAAFAPGDLVDVMVRGSAVLYFGNATALPGSKVYLRKSDGGLQTIPGADGTTLLLPGATVRTARDGSGCAEVVLTRRNLL